GAAALVATQAGRLETGRVPVAPGYPAALPRHDRRPAAAPQHLGASGAGTGRTLARLPRPARTRAPDAAGAGVGAHRAGDAAGDRARGTGWAVAGRGGGGAGCARGCDPGEAALGARAGARGMMSGPTARLAAWTFVAPALAVLGIFFGLPVVAALLLSLTDFDLYALADPAHLRFVALGNYLDLLRTPMFWKALANTTYFVAVGVPLSIAVSLGAALLLNSPLVRMRALFRTALFAPVVTTLVAVAVIWRYLFHTSYGLVNWALGHMGIAPV